MAPQFYVGDPAPWFRGDTASTQQFNFSLSAGRFVCLLFMESTRDPGLAEPLKALAARRALFDDARACFFGVTADPADADRADLADAPGVRWFLDPARAIAGMYGAIDDKSGETRPGWIMLDPTLRVIAFGPAQDFAAVLEQIPSLPDPDLHAGMPLCAPVLVLPRVFEPEFCKTLVELYRQHGGVETGFMREVGGRTVAVVDPNQKRRSDYLIEEEDIRAACRARVLRRLVPEIRKAFQFEATRMERYLIGCYDAAQAGHFRAHRDNTTKGTAHRRFAVTLNLNADEYDGGELRFPEFGRRTYKPPTGGAVVFSCSLLHEATPVTRGQRFAFLPFLYDDAAARIREANNPHLSPGIGAYVAEAPEPPAEPPAGG